MQADSIGRGQGVLPTILWNDQRTGAQCGEIRARLGKPRLIQITGTHAPFFTAPKILWVQENGPSLPRTRHILLPKVTCATSPEPTPSTAPMPLGPSCSTSTLAIGRL
jgi:hypothetical protein